MTEKEQFCKEMQQNDVGAYCPYVKMYVSPPYCRTVCKGDGGDKVVNTIKPPIEKSRRAKGCCGKVVGIAKGYVRLASDSLGITLLNRFAIDRRGICGICDEQTWMSRMGYIRWLRSQGIKVVTHFSILEQLPSLPKQERDEKRQIAFCRLCKCSISAKVRVKNEKCPLDKWKLILSEPESQ